jgi:hypothetical protein
LVRGAIALVMPSLEEGFGLPVLEAMAAGTPVIASDIPSLREVTGGHAIHVDPRSVDAIANAMQNVTREHVEPARERARQFTWRRCASSRGGLPVRALAIAAAAAMLVCHLLGIYALAGRPMHYDENEYLHTSWLMAAGKRIYRDFFEDHPPHLGIMLQSVRPAGELHSIDVRAWTIRARLLSGAFGTLAVLAIMLFAWRMTRCRRRRWWPRRCSSRHRRYGAAD